nr:hypothetical protein [Tanacetum cinerariifolium]
SSTVKAGLICLAAATTELSPTSYPPVRVVKRAFFRSGMSASGIPYLQEVDGSNKGNGNDEVGSGTGNSGGVLDSGAKINVDGAADLIRTIDALVRGSITSGSGIGVNIGNGIRNGGNGYDVGETGDSGGVDMASNLSTSDSEGNVIDDDGDDLSEDDADDEDEEESSDSEKEEEEHLAPTVPTPALHSSISASEDSDQTEPFKEGETQKGFLRDMHTFLACISFMSSNSHATITYTSMSSYEAPPSPDYIPWPEAPPSPDYIPWPEAPPSPDYIPGPEYLEYLPPADDVFPAEEQPLPAAVSPPAESPGYIADSEPEMDPEEEDGDYEKFEGDSIDYPTRRGDDDVDDEDESSDSEKEEEEHLAPTVPAPALHSSISASE